MRILYFIGNGFDLNLGLKTSYKDFYNYYKSLSSKNETVREFKTVLTERNRNWSDMELLIGEYIRNFSFVNIGSFLSLIQDVKLNLKKYLVTQNKYLITQYGLQLESLPTEKFLYDFVDPTSYLLKEDYSNCKAFISNLNKSNCQVDIINFNYTKVVDQIFYKINTEYFSGRKSMFYIADNQIRGYSKIDSVSKCKRTTYAIGQPVHIHGNINSEIILGVNDSSQINNGGLQNLDRTVKSLVKPSLYSDIKAQKCKDLIQSADIIVLFGVSLGKTDKVWWEAIIEHLRNSECRLIIFSYKLSREEVLARFLSFDKTSNRNRLRDKIYVSVNSDMFKIINVKRRRLS